MTVFSFNLFLRYSNSMLSPLGLVTPFVVESKSLDYAAQPSVSRLFFASDAVMLQTPSCRA